MLDIKKFHIANDYLYKSTTDKISKTSPATVSGFICVGNTILNYCAVQG